MTLMTLVTIDAGGGTIFSRAWFGDRSDGVVSTPESTVAEDRDRSPSETPDLTCGLGGIPLSEFVRPIASDIHSVHVDSLIPNDTEVGDRSPSGKLNLLGGLGGKT